MTQWTGVASIPPAIAGGIALRAFFSSLFDPLLVALAFLLISISSSIALFLMMGRSPRARFLGILVFVSLAALLVSARTMVLEESLVSPSLAAEAGKIAHIKGIIAADPDARDTSVILTVKVMTVNDAPSSGKVRISTDRFTRYLYGDELDIAGVPTSPKEFTTDAGTAFDYPHYLLAQGITYEIKNARIGVVAHGKGNKIVSTLLSLKQALSRQIGVILPEPKSALLGGLLLGEKQSLGKDITTAFRNAGVVHMIVLSGYNVSLVARVIQKICEVFLPRTLGFFAGGIGLIAFAIMTGASETTIRASIMALIMLLATALRRPADALRILILAAGMMLFLNPYLLLYDLSFQLSCLATFGLILLSEPIAKLLTFIPEKFALREVAASTIATELVVAPLLIISVGQLSLVSVATNLAVLFAVPWTMLFGFIATILSFVSTWLAFPFTILAYALLNYILVVAMWFGSLPFAIITTPPEVGIPVLIGLGTLYAVLGWLVFRFRQKIFFIKHTK